MGRRRSSPDNIKGGRVGLGLVALLTLFAAVTSAQQVREDEPRYSELANFHRVNDRLYRGAQPRAGGIRKLKALGVNTIINLREADEHAVAEGLEAEAEGLRYFNVPFGRLGRPTDEQVERVLSLINAPESGVVFVHCAKGQDRTGMVIGVYRISHDRWTGEQATKEAEHYGMKFWQRWMKDYILDYYRDHPPDGKPAERERRGRASLPFSLTRLTLRPNAR